MMNKLTEGVGKKIVEALKQQSEIEIKNVVENPVPVEEDNFSNEETEEPITNFNNFAEDTPAVQQSFVPNTMTFTQDSYDLDDFEIPTNVAVLRQLINQLPAGVSKQTGAQIIKQTMEALGISMKSVLQEAQGVQEGLNNSSRECQTSIMEYKKQIGVLERQAQKYQRQSAALNDIISLFVQTNI
jgi:hypothetical protein